MRDLPSRYVEIGMPSINVKLEERIHFVKEKPETMFFFRPYTWDPDEIGQEAFVFSFEASL